MNKIIHIATTASLALIILLAACRKDEEEKSAKIKKEQVSGFVQKGPFINGTQILMSELNSSLEQTGNVFSTQISNSRGSFEISDVQLSSSFVEFTASGFYFDEVRNDISSAQLTLYAISDITDLNTINVNILTHLEKRRVEYLVKENDYSFQDAKQTAQSEVLAAFGISNEEMQSSEALDISVDHTDNAILLAISLILQGNRSVGDLTELLALISSDLRENGVIDNEDIVLNLRLSTLNLDLNYIRQNLEARYQALNISATIPEFESFISVFLDHTPQQPYTYTSAATNITTFSAILNGMVNPNSSLTTVAFEYGTTNSLGNSVVADQSPVSGQTSTLVSAEIFDLTPNAQYYFRVLAESFAGINYGEILTFNTFGIVSDINGNTYQTVLIGEQEWMAENLRTTHYRNGIPIEYPSGDSLAWNSNSTGAYAWHDNNIDWKNLYGALYNWYAVNNENGLCPEDWHVPTDDEWSELIDYVISQGFSNQWNEPNGVGNALKLCRQIDSPVGGDCNTSEHPRWDSHMTHFGTNDFGFSITPGGVRSTNGGYNTLGLRGIFWTSSVSSSSNAWYRSMNHEFGIVYHDYASKSYGFSVRCLRN